MSMSLAASFRLLVLFPLCFNCVTEGCQRVVARILDVLTRCPQGFTC